MNLFILAVVFIVISASNSFAEDPCKHSDVGACREVRESRCRTANDGMLNVMKSTPFEKQRDIEGSKEVIAKVEKMLTENRKRGIDECASWSELGRIVASH